MLEENKVATINGDTEYLMRSLNRLIDKQC